MRKNKSLVALPSVDSRYAGHVQAATSDAQGITVCNFPENGGPGVAKFCAYDGEVSLPTMFGLGPADLRVSKARLMTEFVDGEANGAGQVYLGDNCLFIGRWENGHVVEGVLHTCPDTANSTEAPKKLLECFRLANKPFSVWIMLQDDVAVKFKIVRHAADSADTTDATASSRNPQTVFVWEASKTGPGYQEIDQTLADVIAQQLSKLASVAPHMLPESKGAEAVNLLSTALQQATEALLPIQEALDLVGPIRYPNQVRFSFGGYPLCIEFDESSVARVALDVTDNAESTCVILYNGQPHENIIYCTEGIGWFPRPTASGSHRFIRDGIFRYNAKYYVGKLDRARLTGPGKVLDKNLRLLEEGVFSNDRLHGGPGKMYYPSNGQLWKECDGWQRGRMHGVGAIYTEAGDVEQTGRFDQGVCMDPSPNQHPNIQPRSVAWHEGTLTIRSSGLANDVFNNHCLDLLAELEDKEADLSETPAPVEPVESEPSGLAPSRQVAQEFVVVDNETDTVEQEEQEASSATPVPRLTNNFLISLAVSPQSVMSVLPSQACLDQVKEFFTQIEASNPKLELVCWDNATPCSFVNAIREAHQLLDRNCRVVCVGLDIKMDHKQMANLLMVGGILEPELEEVPAQ